MSFHYYYYYLLLFRVRRSVAVECHPCKCPWKASIVHFPSPPRNPTPLSQQTVHLRSESPEPLHLFLLPLSRHSRFTVSRFLCLPPLFGPAAAVHGEHSSILSPSSFKLYRTTAADSACCTRSKQSRRLYFTAVDFAVLYTHLNDSHRRHRRRRVDPPSPNPSNPLQYCTRSY